MTTTGINTETVDADKIVASSMFIPCANFDAFFAF